MSYLFLLMSVFLFGMSQPNNPSYDEVMRIINKHSKELKKQGIIRRWHGLDYAGPDKVYDGKIHEVSLGYSIDKKLKYEEATQFFYKIADDLLQELNKNEKISTYFYHFPLTYEDLHLAIGFDYESKGHLQKDDIHQISLQFNEIFCSIANVDGATSRLVPKETYPGMGTLTYSGEDAFRTIFRKLPEAE